MIPIGLEIDLRLILTTLAEQGYRTGELIFEPPVLESDVLAVEAELGIPIPSNFRALLTTVSGHVDFLWHKPEGLEYPAPFHSNFCGELNWSLKSLIQIEEGRKNWMTACFPDVENAYDRVWHNKFAFQEVGNGDLIAIDLRANHSGEVVYLSHDGGEGHGLVLAPSFSDFIIRWVTLACAGAEDWQWLPFFKRGFGLNPDDDNAQVWRKLLRIENRPL